LRHDAAHQRIFASAVNFGCQQPESGAMIPAFIQCWGNAIMGNVLYDPRFHARASSVAVGRGTSKGQSQPSGQLSENQAITSSYLRAVKVVAPASTRSKKRQSPAARRPRVAKLTERAEAYAEAQAMRFDLSSDSMTSEISRNFPTSQALYVGNIPLAQVSEKSDKSAMANVDEIRQKVRDLIKEADSGAVAIAKELGLPRTDIHDFLRGKKRKLSLQAATALADRFDLPVKEFISSPEPITIHKGGRFHIYLAEHMEARGLDDEAMSHRMDGIPASTVANWRSQPKKLEDWQISAILHAFGIDDVAELARLPIKQKKATNSTAKAVKGRKIA
jgi:hypothetical protein